MKTRSWVVFAAATLFSMSVHAHDCSGGAAGGMDATGNECNMGGLIATSAEEARTTVLSAGPSSAAPKAAATSHHTSTTLALNNAGAHKAKLPGHHSAAKHSVQG